MYVCVHVCICMYVYTCVCVYLCVQDDLAHYASQGTDLEFQFPFGWGELWGIANRTGALLKRNEVWYENVIRECDTRMWYENVIRECEIVCEVKCETNRVRGDIIMIISFLVFWRSDPFIVRLIYKRPLSFYYYLKITLSELGPLLVHQQELQQKQKNQHCTRNQLQKTN